MIEIEGYKGLEIYLLDEVYKKVELIKTKYFPNHTDEQISAALVEYCIKLLEKEAEQEKQLELEKTKSLERWLTGNDN